MHDRSEQVSAQGVGGPDEISAQSRALHASPGSGLCADCDEDCPHVKNKLACWLYQPERGHCPYLGGNN